MKSLTITGCCNVVEVNIVAPNLHRFEYIGDAISFSLNSSSLSEVSLTLFDALDAEMIEFLAKLSQPKLLTWGVSMQRHSSLFFLFVSSSMLLYTSIISIYYKNLTCVFVFVYFVNSVITARELREILPSPFV
jgi:hypothetical protein